LVSWRAKKQRIVSRSLSEAECRISDISVRELQWLTFLLHDLRVDTIHPTNLSCDSQVYVCLYFMIFELTLFILPICYMITKSCTT